MFEQNYESGSYLLLIGKDNIFIYLWYIFKCINMWKYLNFSEISQFYFLPKLKGTREPPGKPILICHRHERLDHSCIKNIFMKKKNHFQHVLLTKRKHMNSHCITIYTIFSFQKLKNSGLSCKTFILFTKFPFDKYNSHR